jgi:hypothetical protein
MLIGAVNSENDEVNKVKNQDSGAHDTVPEVSTYSSITTLQA